MGEAAGGYWGGREETGNKQAGGRAPGGTVGKGAGWRGH